MLRLHLRKVREKVRGGVANENGLSICIYEPTHLPRANENEKNPLASAIPGSCMLERTTFATGGIQKVLHT